MESLMNKLETIIVPLNGHILLNKDDERTQTKGGIVLPDGVAIPTITGRIVAMSKDIKEDPIKYGELDTLDRVIIKPGNAIPVDLEKGNKLFIVPIIDVIAIFKNKDYKYDQ